MRDEIELNGQNYTIVDQSRVKTSKRVFTQRQRPSQPSESRLAVKTWKLSGPMGNSRQPFFGAPLGVDYTENLDHRYEGLLTSTAKRNALTLTALSAVAYGVPISDVTKTNWSEGAGDGNGNAFEELDEGIESGTPDDATTYWTTTSTDFSNRIECNATSMTDPVVNTGFTVRFRVRVSDASERIVPMLLEGSNARFSALVTPSAANTWITVVAVIPEAIAANFSDFTNLELGIYKFDGSGTLDVSTMELELPDAKSGPVRTIDNQFGFLFANRGAFITQIETGTMIEIENNDRTNLITDTIAEWQTEGIIAYGAAKDVDKRTAATSGGATYGTISGVDATKLALGPERLWLMDAGKNESDDAGKAKYTENSAALTSASLSNPFPVADPGTQITGLFTSGFNTAIGHSRGANSFTESGKPVRLLEALKDFPSVANAAAGDSQWGWTYIATKLGLYAVHIPSLTANPVGPGEGQRGLSFEGPVDGYPTAVKVWKESVWVAYLNPDGTTYVFRGEFGAETGQTGRPEWYLFRKLTALECHAIGATERTNPTLILGENDNIAYYTMSTRGREIADANYEFDTGGGTWFGTTLMLPVGLIGNVRYAKFLAENTATSTDTWQVAVSRNEGSFDNVGAAVATDGVATVRPVTASVPDDRSFTTLKPRLTQVASSESAPPQIRGDFTIAYDERPEHVREVSVLVESHGEDLAALEALVGDDQLIPVTFRNPTDTDVNTGRFAYVDSVEMEDLKNLDDQGIRLTIVEWDLS
jgi:hypothetical protein